MEIHAVWDVDADPSYDIRWPEDKEDLVYPGSYALCHTLGGLGWLQAKDGAEFRCTENRLLILRCNDIARYRCLGASWRFLWVEFTLYGPLLLPLGKLLPLAASDPFQQRFYDLCQALRKDTPGNRRYAAALFMLQLNEWMAAMEEEPATHPWEETIQMVIDEVHNRATEIWPVSEMAALAGMSEPLFRQRFREVTGESPKQFAMRVRMDLAQTLLEEGHHSVADVAKQLGFADPFVFSKAFRRHTKLVPSALKKDRHLSGDHWEP